MVAGLVLRGRGAGERMNELLERRLQVELLASASLTLRVCIALSQCGTTRPTHNHFVCFVLPRSG